MPKPENVKPHEYKPGQSGNPAGRPKRLIANINAELAQEGYGKATKDDIMTAMQTLVNLPISKVSAIANKSIYYKDESGSIIYLEEGDKYPILYRLAAKSLLDKRGGEYMEKLMDRAYGKPKQDADDALPPPTTQRALIDFGNNADGTRITIEI